MVPDATVLVVDDELGVRESLRLYFEQLGVGTICAGNGDDALYILRTAERPPGLIVLDIMMPEMDGWEFRQRQRQDPKLAAIPVVVVTALNDASAITQRLGAVATLRKPIELEQLSALVERYCR